MLMKIKTIRRGYHEVMALPRPIHKNPMKPSLLLSTLVNILSLPQLTATKFSYTVEGMERVKGEPCLILMNHSSFIDLKIAFRMLYPRRFAVVATTDSFVGKAWVMRWLGCIPTLKFVSDMNLITDMKHTLTEKNSSVLMFPEAGYSLDGRATLLPGKMGVLLKHLKVPVVSITTEGAFSHDPLYNELQQRRVKVSAHMKCLLTPEEIAEKSVTELDEILKDVFSFDSFAWQREQGIEITEDFRADGLQRILYKCADCGHEGSMLGKGTSLTCAHCGASYEMDTLGQLHPANEAAGGRFSHIPDWFDWERDCVRQELAEGSYSFDVPVKIGMMVDYKALYMVGEGRLSHSGDGFRLTGCDGALDYCYSPLASHSLNADFFWYEIGDVISFGDADKLFYCFPEGVDVAKARLAAEEIYKMRRSRRSAGAITG